MNVADWSSLTDQRHVAAELFGDYGEHLLTEWLDEQAAKVDNADYARQFSDYIDLPGVAPLDYAHRVFGNSDGKLLGGIRFYRRDLDRPFVEIIAHNFDDLDALRDCVRTEWEMFAPNDLRLRVRPGRFTGPHVRLDVSIHAAPYGQMAPLDKRVALLPFTDPADAITLVERRFEHMQRIDPDLYSNVTPADPEDIRQWHVDGQLRAIIAHNTLIGLLAIVPNAVDWIRGDVVYEEIVDDEFSGNGYAAAAQAVWAHGVAADSTIHLVGTIDHLNIASRKSAERAGRPRILDNVFVAL